MRKMVATLATAAVLVLAGCATAPEPRSAAALPCPAPAPAPTCPACPAAKPCPVCPVCPEVTPPAPPPAKPLQVSSFAELPGWGGEEFVPALRTFLQSCRAIEARPGWTEPCAAARALADADRQRIRAFFEANFLPFRLVNPDGSTDGLITGYYEPLLKGSRFRGPRYPFAVYGVPDDLLVVDLAELHPDLKGLRLRGRLAGRKVVPYYSREELAQRQSELSSKALAWVADPVELFFLQIQGSGRIELENGQRMRVGYADQNGHPYRSIGRLLVEQGELTVEQASMEGIKNWAKANPDRLERLLNSNPSYVFFRELGRGDGGPLGSLGVALTPERSLAIDPKTVPLGSPVYLSTTTPQSGQPLNRLMVAQDTGGAIRGVVRGDFFWGFGPEAGRMAGGMRQRGAMWVLLPRSLAPE